MTPFEAVQILRTKEDANHAIDALKETLLTSVQKLEKLKNQPLTAVHMHALGVWVEILAYQTHELEESIHDTSQALDRIPR